MAELHLVVAGTAVPGDKTQSVQHMGHLLAVWHIAVAEDYMDLRTDLEHSLPAVLVLRRVSRPLQITHRYAYVCAPSARASLVFVVHIH